MESLKELCSHLHLIEEEEDVIDLEGNAMVESLCKGELCLIGKVWLDQVIPKSIIQSTMAAEQRGAQFLVGLGIILSLSHLLIMQISRG